MEVTDKEKSVERKGYDEVPIAITQQVQFNSEGGENWQTETAPRGDRER